MKLTRYLMREADDFDINNLLSHCHFHCLRSNIMILTMRLSHVRTGKELLTMTKDFHGA